MTIGNRSVMYDPWPFSQRSSYWIAIIFEVEFRIERVLV